VKHLAVITIAGLCVASVYAAITQPVAVTGGEVSGVPGKDPGIVVFRGIPFAAPPVGELRWRAPQPVTPWKAVKVADHNGASCIQTIVTERKPFTYEFMNHNDISEDCLSLNVWTPAKTAGEKRPVFVFIYGGGFKEGSVAVPLYDGEGLAKKGLVVVMMNYRLGVLGFLAHPELTRESPNKTSGNYGLLDQVAALQWVRDNIAKFGGDPANVTVAGQSAGAIAVTALTASPLAKGLMVRAIAESGASISSAAGTTLVQAEEAGIAFARAKGARSIADLRAMTWQRVTAPVQAWGHGARTIIDGWFLPFSTSETYAQGKQNDVATITGWNKDEGGAAPTPTATAAVFRAQARGRYGDRAAQFLKLYPAATDAQARISQNESVRDRQKVSTYLWARLRAKVSKTPAWIYFWDHALPGPDAGIYGAFHAAEEVYVLNTLFTVPQRPFTDADRKIADQMSSYWANFAATGDPNGKDLPRWTAVSDKPETMELGDQPGPIPVAGSPEKFAFWENFLSR
jgi:para-nitrobenzyl esterase